MSANEGGQQQAATAVANSQQAPTSITSSQVSSPMTSQAMSQHQMQLQHTTTTTTAAVHGQHQVHHHATAQGGNPMQQLQVIQQPSYLPQLYNPNGQIMLQPGNIALHHPGINPQIQVITGKTFQQNQLGGPHMLTAATSYTALPTSAANNQAYIIGQLINSNPQLQQQISQAGKPGEMKNVITSPQLGAQLPQGLSWASPHTLFTTTGPNGQIFIRGAQPDQMFIQQQQPMHNTGNSHQHFSMPLTGTTQIPTTSIGQANNTLQQQQQQATSVQQAQQIQAQGTQAQAPLSIQPQPTNVVSIKGPAVLQPKPAPLQIQPQPTQQQQQQHQQQQLQQQQLAQLQQVTMTQMGHQPQQIQMIPQQGNTQQTNLQSISLTSQQGQQLTTTQVIQQAQQQHLQQTQARQLTILPQQPQQHIQQQMPIIQQQQQHQPIRPNYTVANLPNTTIVQNTTMTQGNNQQKAKMKKPGAGRGTPNGSPQGKAIFQRAPMPTNISPMPPQKQPNLTGATLMKVPTSMGQIVQPLKTINLSALHSSTPNLPDATLTPLNPQQNLQMSVQNHQIHLYTASPTQMPSPNISITPTNMQPIPQQTLQQQSMKEEESSDAKGDTEKENNDSEDMMGMKQKLPKAMVKPQVLTHVIEGFVIQEAAEPFPMPKNGDIDEPPKKKMAMNGEMGKCELCGKVDLRAKFKKGKRFCSSACVKEAKSQHQNQAQVKNNESNKQRANNGKGRKWENGGDETDETNSSIGEASHNEDQGDEEPKVNPAKWSVEEVVDFVRNLPGCSEHAKEFEEQEIDGQALMLLKEDHLMSAMGMKLGPALKLVAKIDVIRGTPNGGPQPEQTKV